MKKKIKILIVGGTGFIGYHLCSLAVKKKWLVTSISTRAPQKKRKVKKVKYIKVDITNKQKLKKKIRDNFDYVVNLGGYVDHSKKLKTIKSHFNGCKNLVHILKKENLKRFIQLGSASEYGKCISPVSEKSVCKPRSSYGKAKYLATKYLLNEFKEKKFPAVILRLFQAYGPAQDNNRLLPYVIEECLKNTRFKCSPGNQFRDFLYIDDLIELIFACLKKKKLEGQIFNVGSGKVIKIKDIIKKINNIIKKGTPEFGGISMRKDETLKVYPDIRKIKKRINWHPKTNLNSGLRKTIYSFKI